MPCSAVTNMHHWTRSVTLCQNHGRDCVKTRGSQFDTQSFTFLGRGCDDHCFVTRPWMERARARSAELLARACPDMSSSQSSDTARATNTCVIELGFKSWEVVVEAGIPSIQHNCGMCWQCKVLPTWVSSDLSRFGTFVNGVLRTYIPHHHGFKGRL